VIFFVVGRTLWNFSFVGNFMKLLIVGNFSVVTPY
jgi:hypothetical protein